MQLKIASTAKPGRTASSSDLNWKSPAFQDVRTSVLISMHHKDKVKPRSLDMSPEQEGDRYKKWVPTFILFLFKELLPKAWQLIWTQRPTQNDKWLEADAARASAAVLFAACTASPHRCSPPSRVLLTHYAMYNTARLSHRVMIGGILVALFLPSTLRPLDERCHYYYYGL